jgi:murein DD-endopeptidase MepM/ murein hydrolase activator NlpD
MVAMDLRHFDIAVPQGSIVRSISDGIVYAVKDGGEKGFSYVLIGHRDGYASLYGHVSSFLVRKGDVVAPGQAIALSGGLPGTHGAGPMTTGAHVHLEITKDGVHVNPLSVLPAK